MIIIIIIIISMFRSIAGLRGEAMVWYDIT